MNLLYYIAGKISRKIELKMQGKRVRIFEKDVWGKRKCVIGKGLGFYEI